MTPVGLEGKNPLEMFPDLTQRFFATIINAIRVRAILVVASQMALILMGFVLTLKPEFSPMNPSNRFWPTCTMPLRLNVNMGRRTR
jgi:hypothetical protein